MDKWNKVNNYIYNEEAVCLKMVNRSGSYVMYRLLHDCPAYFSMKILILILVQICLVLLTYMYYLHSGPYIY